MNQTENRLIFEKIKKGDEVAFEKLFKLYYPSLCNFAYQMLGDDESAEEVVQEIFVKLWEKRLSIEIEVSVNNYLFRSVKNHCLNIIQHEKIKNQYSEKIRETANQNQGSAPNFLEPGLIEKIEKAVGSMPERRLEIFRLSREEGLKYKEIAEKLGISVKTVEAQMGLALKYLREALKDYNPNLMLFYIFYSPNKGN
jgi:RNA polymerase sigma-70 factor (ECF subfamily)